VSEHYCKLLRFAIRRSFSLIFPCTAGIFVLGVAGINLLYGHGDFSREATYQTVICLWGYGLGLLPAVFVMLLAPAFYADKEFRVPMVGSLAAVALNILLTSLFVFILHWGALSIAIATSLSAWFNYFYLSHRLSKKLGEPLIDKAACASFVKTGTSSLLAAAATLFVGTFFVEDPTLNILSGDAQVVFSRDFAMQLMQFVALGGTFVLIFLSYAWMLGAEDILEWIGVKERAREENT
jgi:putative peptidoglycan lipid II flippase